MLALNGSLASAQVCSVHFTFGRAQLATSDFAAGRYGAELRYLYGEWEWPTFGLNVSVVKADRYVQDIAQLVRDCIGDLQHGRLNFARRQVIDPQTRTPRSETDKEYFVRAFDELVAIRRQFATIERDYPALLHAHAPLVPDSSIPALKSTVNSALLRTLDLAANRTTGLGWVLVLMQDLNNALDRFTTNQELTRQLINVFLNQFPSLRGEVINQLINNTNSVLDQYGQFFSEERRANLEALLAEVVEQGEEEDMDALIANLNQIADQLQIEFDALWNTTGPLRTMADKLKFIFGACASTPSPHPLVTTRFFGDLPVATRILQEGNDAALCAL
jgi:hypothetical protein